jgi:tRNA pseudouridine55 synthase
MKKNSNLNNIHGVLLLDKPNGITSNAALQQVKRLYSASKAGHTGSLDPLACGMLPLCFGEATKFSQYLLDANKHYIVVAKLGVKTTTGDAEGKIIQEIPVNNVSNSELTKILCDFQGDIKQIPSMYSAIKVNGEPLYKLARQGIEIPRAERAVTIHELSLLTYNNNCLTLEVRCSKGTYIRTLIEDIGEALGYGAHVIYLRRLAVGHFDASQMVTMSAVEAAKEQNTLQSLLLPTTSIIEDFPVLRLSNAALFYLRRGEAVMAPKTTNMGFVRIESAAGEFLGVGVVRDDGKVAPQRLVKQSGAAEVV